MNELVKCAQELKELGAVAFRLTIEGVGSLEINFAPEKSASTTATPSALTGFDDPEDEADLLFAAGADLVPKHTSQVLLPDEDD